MRRIALALLILAAIGCGEPGGRNTTTRNQLKELKTDIELFQLTVGRLPANLDELTRSPDGVRDAWDEAYVYEPGLDTAGEPVYRLLSKGPDRIRGTADDLELTRR